MVSSSISLAVESDRPLSLIRDHLLDTCLSVLLRHWNRAHIGHCTLTCNLIRNRNDCDSRRSAARAARRCTDTIRWRCEPRNRGTYATMWIWPREGDSCPSPRACKRRWCTQQRRGKRLTFSAFLRKSLCGRLCDPRFASRTL